MGRMNIYFDDGEDKKLDRLKIRFDKKSKEDVIKSLIKQFPEVREYLDKEIQDSKIDAGVDDLI
jgi:hypothetical protein